MNVGIHALDLVGKRVGLSGSIVCQVTDSYRAYRPPRTWARIASDQFFPEMGNELSEYVGTIFRFRSDGSNQTVTGYLTRKEALFGELGRPDHEPLVNFDRSFETLHNTVIVVYQELSERDLEYLKKLLPKIGLRET